ncbi:MAG: iron ABC transporter permease [Butyricicoccus sp.]|nr:iron ABC transporter permease [Butyricicoccus sp.]
MGSFFAAVVFCLVSALLSLCLGAARLSPADLWNALRSGPHDTAGWIFWYSRLPRTAACLLAGCALAVSGCVIQSVLGNKLASPSILGVNAGAGLAVNLCCAFGLLSGWSIALCSFSGAMLSVLLVVFLTTRTGASRTTVILAGVAMNSILSALSEAVITLVPDVSMLSGDFRIGGFSSVVSSRLLPAGILILLALLVLLTLSNDLDVLALGEETAHSLGLSVGKIRILFLLLAALLAGAAVSFAGLLGFVGLLVPHAARKMVGSRNSLLLPFSALAGAGFVSFCDVLARILFDPYEIPVGILISAIGGPFFLLLLLKKKGGRVHG